MSTHWKLSSDVTAATGGGARANDVCDISAVIPVYRGAHTITELCRQLIAAFEKSGHRFEIILVDDGSKDGSYEIVRELARKDQRIIGVELSRNFGQHNATLCGFRVARGRLIVTLDEDIQNPPEEIDNLIKHAQQTQSDVVYGIPRVRQHSWWRKLGSRLVMIVPRRVMKIDFDISPFRLLRAPIAKEAAKVGRHDVILDIYLAWLTDRISAKEVEHGANDSVRPSSYSLWKLIRVLLNVMCNYTVLPLRLASILGVLISIASIAIATYFILFKLIHGLDVPGFTAIIVTLLFSTGMILMGIGVLSEYLARTILYIHHKPQSFIRSTTRETPDVDH